MRSQLVTLLLGVLFIVSVSAQHHNTTATFVDGCYYLDSELVGCIKSETQPCDEFWYFQLSAPVAEDTFFVIGEGYVYYNMDFLQCYSSADGEKCFCLSFQGNTLIDEENVLTTPGITTNCNNFRIHAFDPITIYGTTCGSAYYHFPCPQLFWALPLIDDEPPAGGNGQIIDVQPVNNAAAGSIPTVFFPQTDGGANGNSGDGSVGSGDPIDDFPYYGGYYTSYIDVSPALIDDLLLFFMEHTEYPLGDYLHVQWECLYLSAPQEFADNNPYGFNAVERLQFYCPTIVLDTCNGDAALESKFGVLLQTPISVGGDNSVATVISGFSIVAYVDILELGENYIGASVNVMFVDDLNREYEADLHLAYTYPHCGLSTLDCPNPWGSFSYIGYSTEVVSGFFSWIMDSPSPASSRHHHHKSPSPSSAHHHHHHHKSPSPSTMTFSATASFSSFSSAMTSFIFSSGVSTDNDSNLAWLSLLIVVPVLLVVIVLVILVFAVVVKKAGALQQKRELNDGENVYSMMINNNQNSIQ